MSWRYLIVVAIAILTEGCATNDVNPRTAHARKGYVDFYADESSGLCWQIRRLEADQHHGKTLLEEFKPRTNEIVRLAFAPGKYRLGITFLNRAVLEPAAASVAVEDGKITPVSVTLVETGSALIESKEQRMGASYARTGRTTKFRATEGAIFRAEAQAHHPISYQPKERMSSGAEAPAQ